MLSFARLGRALPFVAVLLSTIIAGFVLPSQAQQPDGRAESASPHEPLFRVSALRSELRIVERFAKTVELEKRIVRVDGFDPDVIDVTALTPHQIRVQAVAPGVTTMVLVDENGQMYSVDVFITGDVRHLQAYISHFFPDSSVEAVEVRESVVLRGWVTQPEHITQLVELAEQFYPRVINQMHVGGVQQVLLKVKVYEVQRSKIRKLGFNFLHMTSDSYTVSTPGQLVAVSSLTFRPPDIDFTNLADPTISFGISTANSLFQGFVEALKEEGLLKIMAEPALVATNGRPATMLNGGEFPILVPQSLGTTTIEWREFGVRMEAVAIILGNGRVRLEIAPEVSERDFTNSVQVGGSIVPGLTVRRANTQVEMNFGQTLVIAGLIANRDTANYSKIPLLGDIPWISTAFSRKRYDQVETEVVIMVTPELVAPLEASQVPPGGPGQFTDAPTFREMFHGHIEIPSYGNPCENCYEWIGPGAYGSDPDSAQPAPAVEEPAIPPAPGGSASSLSKPDDSLAARLTRWNPFSKQPSAPSGTAAGVRPAGHQVRPATPGETRHAAHHAGSDEPSHVRSAEALAYPGSRPVGSAGPGLIEPGSNY